ncbi:hypothetical protein LVD15_24585 [Fulvivirga maritima]|uniref:hypothetical protein n=1 Tax=Fulvivirga maritima TaxID=2904247 RepID=UPI001F45F1D3|nr:hypothetical protein [Fulvivirga maritima]UII26435.1 hypothetical protein LVD15_24585 [Fulvivirga maritima]
MSWGRSIGLSELFDNAELNGTKGTQPMIQIEAILGNNRYYNEYIYPLVYKEYPLEGRFRVLWRDSLERTIGVPPVKAVFVKQAPQTNLKLSEMDISSGAYINPSLSAAFIYNLSHYYSNDFHDLQNQAANFYADKGTGAVSSHVMSLLQAPFPVILSGPYQIKVKYVLPGKNEVVSEKVITITNPME